MARASTMAMPDFMYRIRPQTGARNRSSSQIVHNRSTYSTVNTHTVVRSTIWNTDPYAKFSAGIVSMIYEATLTAMFVSKKTSSARDSACPLVAGSNSVYSFLRKLMGGSNESYQAIAGRVDVNESKLRACQTSD